MKSICTTIKSILLSLALSCALSCTEEDLRNCPDDTMRLYFSLDTELTRVSGIDPASIEVITLFVFDRYGYYYGQYTDSEPRVDDPGYYMKVTLEEGTYHLVAWCNLRDPFYITTTSRASGLTTLDDAILGIVTDDDNTVTALPHLLFHGAGSDVKVVSHNENVYRMPVVCDTYRINVTTKGLPEYRGPYRLVVEDDNGTYKFDNSVVSSGKLKYNAPLLPDVGGNPAGSVSVLRLHEERRGAEMKIYGEGYSQPVFDENLIGILVKYLMLETGSAKVSSCYEYDIFLDFPDDGSDMVIHVNGWNLTEEEHDISQ